MSNAFAPIVRARPIPIFGRPVHQGSPPIDYSPILLLKPFGFRIAPDTLSSDENLVGQRGITPAFGYSAPHPSAGGTLTLLIHALPSAHYEGATTSRPRKPGPLWFRFQAPRAPPVFVSAEALLTSPEEFRQARNTWSAGVPIPGMHTRGRVRDLTGSLAIHPMPLPCSKTPAEPARSRLGDLVGAAPGQPKPKASAGT